MRITITDKGVSTRLTKRDIRSMRKMVKMLDLMAQHQPIISAYAAARDAINDVVAMHPATEPIGEVND